GGIEEFRAGPRQMLRTLKRLLGRSDPFQLTLPLERPPQTPRRQRGANSEAAERLLGRLRAYGLVRITRCRLTRNRNVMVSFSGGEVRVHEGYLDAPDEVLRAIVVFVEGRTRAERRAAQRTIVSHPIRTVTSRARVERTRPEDQGNCDELARWHARFNTRHFHGRLKPVAIRISRRMHSRLGHYTAASPGDPAEIAISWRHLRRHGWQEALHTLLHEM